MSALIVRLALGEELLVEQAGDQPENGRNKTELDAAPAGLPLLRFDEHPIRIVV